jgi:hypothetical protein
MDDNEQTTMSVETTEPPPTTADDHARKGRSLPRWVRDAAVVLIAIAAGFGSSYLHPGPRGLTGPDGPRGPQGIQGAAGPTGSSASAQHLGICYDTSDWTNTSAGIPPLLTSVTVTSPSKSKDGTVSCDMGTFIPVTPQNNR